MHTSRSDTSNWRDTNNSNPIDEQPIHTTQGVIANQQGMSTNQPSDRNEYISKWVENISDRRLSQDEINVLSKGSGFAVSPGSVPIDEYIVATEIASRALDSGQAAAMRAEIVQILDEAKTPPPNLTKGEQCALKELQKDNSIVICPADKRKCLVVMNKQD